jgi:hypothetical protein
MHSGRADTLDDFQLYEPVGQQLQRPTCPAFRWRAACFGHQPGLGCAVQFTILATGGRLAEHRRLKTFLYESLPHSMDGRETDLRKFRDARVGPCRPLFRFIRLQQNTCSGSHGFRSPPFVNQCLQLFTFISLQPHQVLRILAHGFALLSRMLPNGKGEAILDSTKPVNSNRMRH